MHNCLQAERWGSELYTEDVEHVDLSSRPFTVRTSDTQVLSSQAMMLWMPCTAYPPPPPPPPPPTPWHPCFQLAKARRILHHAVVSPRTAATALLLLDAHHTIRSSSPSVMQNYAK